MSDVTRILSRIENGDGQAAERLLPLVYHELRQLAAAKMAQEKPGQTLQPTALVHEAYLRLVDQDQTQHWNSRGHFYAAAAEAMRRILVERARRKGRLRHGGAVKRVKWSEDTCAATARQEDLILIDEALALLEQEDSGAAELIKLRYFAGCSLTEIAALMSISPRTADRLWAYAKAWLHDRLKPE
ncbi:MAG: ECF-type sigma factor [Planctomycetota bacterium]